MQLNLNSLFKVDLSNFSLPGHITSQEIQQCKMLVDQDSVSAQQTQEISVLPEKRYIRKYRSEILEQRNSLAELVQNKQTDD
jgi:hypothetical protein